MSEAGRSWAEDSDVNEAHSAHPRVRELVTAVAAVLDSLADGAGPDHVDDLVAEVVAVAGAGDLEKTMTRAARRAYQAVQHKRQRESELGALYATARDLVALRDVEDAMTAVVHRAQQVLPGADTTYLCLKNDDTGEFRVLASVGLISPDFRHVIVPPGHGMSEVIADTRAPLRVRRYLGDSTIRHDPGLDDALAKDGLTSVVGVPLIARDQMLGVLFAANRQERAFTDEETALLTAMADAGALAIDNSRLFAQARHARRALEVDNRALRQSADLHDRLTRLVLRGADVAQVLDALADVFSGGLMLFDRDDVLITCRGATTAPERLDENWTEALTRSRHTGHAITTSLSAETQVSIAAIATGASYLGALVVTDTELLTPTDARNLEQAAQIVALLTLLQNARTDAEKRVRGELLVELLTINGPLPDVVRHRAQARALDLDQPLGVLVLRGKDPKKLNTLRRRVQEVAAAQSGLAGEFGGQLVYIGPFPVGPGAFATELHQRLHREGYGNAIVCASPTVNARAGELREAHSKAQRAVELLVALGQPDAAVRSNDLLIFSALFDPARTDELHGFVDSTIGPVLANDETRGSELVKTLQVFFHSGSNAARTARELYVHPNTVIKRLEHVARLLGPHWNQEPSNLAIRVALQLHLLGQPSGRQPQPPTASPTDRSDPNGQASPSGHTHSRLSSGQTSESSSATTRNTEAADSVEEVRGVRDCPSGAYRGGHHRGLT